MASSCPSSVTPRRPQRRPGVGAGSSGAVALKKNRYFLVLMVLFSGFFLEFRCFAGFFLRVFYKFFLFFLADFFVDLLNGGFFGRLLEGPVSLFCCFHASSMLEHVRG